MPSFWNIFFLYAISSSWLIAGPRIVFLNDRIPAHHRLNATEQQEITNVIEEVTALLGDNFESPPIIRLEVSKEPSSGRDRFEKDTFTIVMSWANPDLRSKRATLSHEYAHGILHFNSEKRHKFHKEMENLDSQKKQITQDQASGKISREEGNRRWGDNFSRALHASMHFDRYHELFADTVAVMLTKDPSSISRSIYQEVRETDIEHKAHLRDFSKVHLPTALLLEDCHLYFSPLRSKLGAAGLGSFDLATNRSILEKMFETIGGEVSARLLGPVHSLNVEDVRNENDRVGISLLSSLPHQSGESTSPCKGILQTAAASQSLGESARLQEQAVQEKLHSLMHTRSPISELRKLLGN